MATKAIISVNINMEANLNEERSYSLSTRLEHILNTKLEEILASRVPGAAQITDIKVSVQVEEI